MRNWIFLLGVTGFISCLFLLGDFIFASFLTKGFYGYWPLKSLYFLGISLVIVGCLFILFRKNVLIPFVGIASKLEAINDLKRNRSGISSNWKAFLVNLYNTIEDCNFKAIDLERELLDVRAKYDSILDTQSELVFGMDAWGYMIYSNKSFRTIMQLDKENADNSFLHNDYESDKKISRILNSCEKSCLNEAKKAPSGYQFVGALEEDAGARYIDWIVKYVSPVSGDETGGVYLFVGRDITNEHLIKKQNQRLEKLASIGKVAHFISHEINQPITTIRLASSNLELLLEEQCRDCSNIKPITSKAKKIICQTQRIEKIIKELKAFNSRQELFKSFKLYPALESVVENFESSGLKFLDVRLEGSVRSVIVNGVELLFQQAVQNIINNAIDAIEENNIDIPKISIVLEVKPDKKAVTLRFRDNGGGCSPEALARVTEIFYTTKKPGKGSGMGIPFCFSVIEKMNGKLEFTNIAGGLEVAITIPCSIG